MSKRSECLHVARADDWSRPLLRAQQGSDGSRDTRRVARFVLVRGGWHGGWCFRWLAEELAAHGHDVVAPDLPCEQVGLTPLDYAREVGRRERDRDRSFARWLHDPLHRGRPACASIGLRFYRWSVVRSTRCSPRASVEWCTARTAVPTGRTRTRRRRACTPTVLARSRTGPYRSSAVKLGSSRSPHRSGPVTLSSRRCRTPRSTRTGAPSAMPEAGRQAEPSRGSRQW